MVRPLNHLLTHVSFVREACGSNIQYALFKHLHAMSFLSEWHVAPIYSMRPPSHGVARGSKITPAPYEKAQASDVMYKRAARPSNG